MAYQALYRKYRPQLFADVLGQEHITTTLKNQVESGRVSHAYVFSGSRGTGKTTTAKILARAVNCAHPVNGEPCGECEYCLAAADSADIIELDAASNNGVDEIRDLREKVKYPPQTGRYRVYIIDEVHMLSKDAFNALLKIMEEPPAHLLFILATTEIQKVPATILSRCQRFNFKRILPHDMEQQLLKVAKAEAIDLTPDGADLLARMANGALRDALSLLDQCRAAGAVVDGRSVLDTLGLAGSTQTVQLMRLLLARQGGDALALLDQLYRGGKDVGALLGELSDLCRDMTVLAAAPEGGAALLGGLYDRKTLSELTAEVPMRRLLYMTDTIQRTAAALPRSIRQRTDAELCLLRLCDESLSNDTEALADRVSALEDALKKGVVPAERPAARPAVAPTPPPRREVSPIPQETSPAPEPAPVPTAPAPPAPAPERTSAAPAAGGDSQVWAALIEHYKGPLTIPDRVWLNQATGTLEGDVLTVSCANDLVKQQLSRKAIEDVLCGVTSRHVGRPVRVQFTVGGGPAAPVRRAPVRPAPRPTPAPSADDYERPPLPEEAPPAPPDLPPWEVPAPHRDKLDELVENAKQLDNFRIK